MVGINHLPNSITPEIYSYTYRYIVDFIEHGDFSKLSMVEYVDIGYCMIGISESAGFPNFKKITKKDSKKRFIAAMLTKILSPVSRNQS